MDLSQPLIRRPTLRAIGWLLWPRVLTYAVWALVPSNVSPTIITLLCLLDAAVLLAQALLIRSTDIRASGPAIALTFRLMQILIFAVTLTTLLDRLADAHAKPPPPPPPPARLEVRNNTAIFEGQIDLDAFNALAETLRTEPTVMALQLTSAGGNIPAARGMARLVTEAGLSTRAKEICASACTLIFMAGRSRQLAPEARLGFHAYRLDEGPAMIDPETEQQRDRIFLSERGVSSEFLDRAFATPHQTMWFPARNELIAAGVLQD